MFMTDRNAKAYIAFQAARKEQLTMKTNDLAHAQRSHQDVIRQGLAPSHPTRVALKARLERFQAKFLQQINVTV